MPTPVTSIFHSSAKSYPAGAAMAVGGGEDVPSGLVQRAKEDDDAAADQD